MTDSVGDVTTPGRATSLSRPGVWVTEASLALMALIWGVNVSVVKYGTQLLAPLAYNGVRVLLAAIALSIIALVWGSRLPARRDFFALLGLGFLGNGIYQVFFVEGVSLTRAGDAALVIAATPAFIALISRLRGLERVSARAAAGIFLSIAGIALVVYSGTQETTKGSSLFGDFLVLCGSLCWSVYSVLLTPYARRVDGLYLAALTMVGGAIPLVVVASGAIAAVTWSAVPRAAWEAMAFSGFGALVIAYLLWYRGVRTIGPTRTAVYANLQPVFALLVAWVMLREAPTVWQSIGAASIMTGAVLARA